MLFLTSREREKSSSPPELPILIQEVSWIEGVGCLPLVLVKQHRSQIGNNCDSLVIKKKKKSQRDSYRDNIAMHGMQKKCMYSN